MMDSYGVDQDIENGARATDIAPLVECSLCTATYADGHKEGDKCAACCIGILYRIGE